MNRPRHSASAGIRSVATLNMYGAPGGTQNHAPAMQKPASDQRGLKRDV